MPRKRAQFGEITEDTVDAYLSDLMVSSKGNYIVQSIGFNKKDPREMKLLRTALLASSNFSGLVKDSLNLILLNNNVSAAPRPPANPPKPKAEPPAEASKKLMSAKSRNGFM